MTDDIAEQGRRLHAAYEHKAALLAAGQAYLKALVADPTPLPAPAVVVAELAEILEIDSVAAELEVHP